MVIAVLLLNACSSPNTRTPSEETPTDTVTVEQSGASEPTLELNTTLEQETEEEYVLAEDPATFDSTGKPSRPEFRNLQVDTAELFGVWTQDLSYPTAEFILSKEDYYIADYDDNGSIPYIIEGDLLTVFFEHGESTGKISQTANDTLTIIWDYGDPEQEYEITYFRFDN